MSNLSFMLISFVHLLYELSILFFLDDLEELHDYMLIWSFILCWNYALMLFKFARINFESLPKPLFLQQKQPWDLWWYAQLKGKLEAN